MAYLFVVCTTKRIRKGRFSDFVHRCEYTNLSTVIDRYVACYNTMMIIVTFLQLFPLKKFAIPFGNCKSEMRVKRINSGKINKTIHFLVKFKWPLSPPLYNNAYVLLTKLT